MELFSLEQPKAQQVKTSKLAMLHSITENTFSSQQRQPTSRNAKRTQPSKRTTQTIKAETELKVGISKTWQNTRQKNVDQAQVRTPNQHLRYKTEQTLSNKKKITKRAHTEFKAHVLDVCLHQRQRVLKRLHLGARRGVRLQQRR